jgi:hypothetical protein
LIFTRLARLICLLWLAGWMLPSGVSNGASNGVEVDQRPRLLVIDFGLASPQLHAGMAAVFADAGYAVELRPDYPQLVKKDFRAYPAIMLLAGNTPELPGAMLTPRALAPLADFVRDGGVLLLGGPVNMTGGLAGENERTLFNALLRRLDIPILIEKGRVTDPVEHYADTLYDAPWFYVAPGPPLFIGLGLPAALSPELSPKLSNLLPDRLQLPRAAALTVGEGAAALVQTSPTAVVESHGAGGTSSADHEAGLMTGRPLPVLAVGVKGKGLVVVGSRDLFNPTGAYQVDVPLMISREMRLARRQLVERLARYTIDWLRHTVEWRPLGQVAHPAPPSASWFQEDRPPFWRSGRMARRLPEGVQSIRIMGRVTEAAASPSLSPSASNNGRAAWLRSLPSRFRWLTEQGIRAGWAYVDREASFQRAVRDAFVGARLNLLWGSMDAELLATEGRDSQKQELMKQWGRMDRLLRTTGVRWFMGSHYPGAHAKLSGYPEAVGAQGQTIGGMSPLDRRFWESEIFPVLRAEATFSLRHPSVGGLLIDLEMYPLKAWYFTNGFDFSDLAFALYVRDLEQRGLADDAAQARGLAPADRFDWLLEQGRWAEYRMVLEVEAEAIGRRLRETVETINPDLMMGFYAAAMPTSWFYSGLLRGAGDATHPVVLLTFQYAPDEELDEAFTRGIELVHGGAILLGQVGRDELRAAIHERLARDQGYWLNNLATLATADPAVHRRSTVESPKDGTPKSYLRAIAEANRSFRRERQPPPQ